MTKQKIIAIIGVIFLVVVLIVVYFVFIAAKPKERPELPGKKLWKF